MVLGSRTWKWVALCVWSVSSAAWALNDGLGEVPEGLERDTPLATVNGFLNAAHAGEYETAAHYLDLSKIPTAAQPERGPALARRLKFIIDRKIQIDLSKLVPDSDQARDNSNHRSEELAVLPLDHVKQPVRLVLVSMGDDQSAWVFSRDTVRAIDKLFDAYGPPLAETLPDWFFRYSFLQLELWQWGGMFALLLASMAVAWAASGIVARVLRRVGAMVHRTEIAAFGMGLRRWVRAGTGAGLVWAVLPSLYLTPSADVLVSLAARTVFIVALAGMVLRILTVACDVTVASVHEAPSGYARVRSLRTQLSVLRRIAATVVYVLTFAVLLFQIPAVRNVGASLLASAGLAGLVVGLAAQKSISTLLAGIQLTVTQPIRIGDTILVEGETGTVEELTLTFVTVQLADLRRLILPMTYFLEKPFQNWSRGEMERNASVNLRTTQKADVEAIRSEVQRVLTDSGRTVWDGKLPNVLVTDAGPDTWLVRLLVGAKDKAAISALQDLLAERLQTFLQQHPDWVNRTAAGGA